MADHGGPLGRLYRWLGPAYPTAVLAVNLLAVFPVALVSVAIFGLYIDTGAWRLGGFTGWVLAVVAAAAAVTVVRGHRWLAPVRAWIRGERDPAATEAAWRRAVALPLDLVPRSPLTTTLAVLAITGGAVALLDPTWLQTLFVFGGAWVAAGYVAVLDYFTIERGLAPVVADLGRDLPDEVDFGRARLPLRWKLLAALPLINLITGVVVAGLSSPGSDLAALGIDVLVATAVALTIALALTLRVASSLERPLRDLASAAERVRDGDLTARVPVTTADEVGRLALTFNRMTAGLAEREQLDVLFGTYVDREVADLLLEDGADPEGEQLDATAVFVDVRGFTRLAEHTPARELVARLNRLFELVVPIVHEHGGHVDTFVGDGLLAVFGAPRRDPRHADRALAAGRAIARAVPTDLDDDLRVGIGISSGPVVAGNLGGGGRLEFSVIGDAVNVAARVEDATRRTGDTLLLTGSTARRLEGGADGLVERATVTVRGRDRAVSLWAPTAPDR